MGEFICTGQSKTKQLICHPMLEVGHWPSYIGLNAKVGWIDQLLVPFQRMSRISPKIVNCSRNTDFRRVGLSVCKMKHIGSTSLLWTVLVCSGQYRYDLGNTGPQIIPVLPHTVLGLKWLRQFFPDLVKKQIWKDESFFEKIIISDDFLKKSWKILIKTISVIIGKCLEL